MLQDKIKAIDAEVLQLLYKWKHFRQIFGSKEKAALLNDTAPVFFSYLWNLILYDISLSTAKLLDPGTQNKNENLSFENLCSEIPDNSLRVELLKLISELKGRTKDIKIWRDKKIAHNDLTHSLKINSVPPIQADDLTEAMAVIQKIMNMLHQKFSGFTQRYEFCFAHDPGDGKSLMYHLKYGFDASREDYSKSDMRRDCEIIQWLKD